MCENSPAKEVSVLSWTKVVGAISSEGYLTCRFAYKG